MRRQDWLRFLNQWTVPLDQKEGEWVLAPFGRSGGPRELSRAREDRSGGKEVEDDGDVRGARLRIHPRTLSVVAEGGSRNITSLCVFDAEILDTSDEDSLIFYWRHRENHGWDKQRQQCKTELCFEHGASIPWEDILVIEYIGIARREDRW